MVVCTISLEGLSRKLQPLCAYEPTTDGLTIFSLRRDVSANGAYIGLDIKGQTGPIGFGTSYASPIWASTITLVCSKIYLVHCAGLLTGPQINTARSNAGKTSVGFINPTLYANPSAMNDVTSGHNPGCGTEGFEAVEGWDPVSVTVVSR